MRRAMLGLVLLLSSCREEASPRAADARPPTIDAVRTARYPLRWRGGIRFVAVAADGGRETIGEYVGEISFQVDERDLPSTSLDQAMSAAMVSVDLLDGYTLCMYTLGAHGQSDGTVALDLWLRGNWPSPNQPAPQIHRIGAVLRPGESEEKRYDNASAGTLPDGREVEYQMVGTISVLADGSGVPHAPFRKLASEDSCATLPAAPKPPPIP